ncbi:sulfatase-like hydrolase/transferase [Agromyces sp. CFH 90414]|uniref:Sulfatase-like hydrolase/transferase n=1 Tax=Agromyces agglutinans TaxID=2662258 RepID=A0A6I2F8Z4_9MICO|nr:sulfatase [Agromyces agglutinans]MRG60247.1 sulfatase-like hydrolase/transferase [Agromyces agglutinans]
MARNILIIHCHDLGRFLGAYGVETVSTPHLDALAAESTVFEHAFSTAPHCSPARASLFTGSYPQQNGVLGLTHEPFGWDLRDPSTHLAHRLRGAGYRTELVGVHHESKVLADDEVAARLGFDRVRTGGDRDVVARRAIEALDRAAEAADEAGAPFYLQVGFNEPHRSPSDRDPLGVMGFLGEHVEPDASRGITVPAHLRDDEGARTEMAELQGAVRAMDEGVGRVLARLSELGLDEHTVVVFTTDHGLALPRAKCTLYDAGTGVALLIRTPDRREWRSRRVNELVSHVDVVPTLFELVDLPAPDGVAGRSLVPLIEQGVPAREHAFGQLTYHTYYDPKRSVRSATHKLIVNFSNAPRAMDPTQSWVHRSLPADLAGPTIGTSPTVELYDLRTDPHETSNLAGDDRNGDEDRRATFAALAAALLDWMRETGDPLLAPQPGHRRHRQALAALEEAARLLEPALP